MKAVTCCVLFGLLMRTTTESEMTLTYDFYTTASLIKFSSLFNYTVEHYQYHFST